VGFAFADVGSTSGRAARPQQTPDHAARQWLDSPGHRALLLAKTWTVMGVELTQRHAAVDFGRRC
jgi:uncharacterized protein YkwD